MDFTGYTAKTERMQLRPYVLDDFEARQKEQQPWLHGAS